MMSPSWRGSRVLAGTMVFLLSCAYLYWIAGDMLQMAGDEGIYLEGGRRVAMGQQPYRDFFALTGPLTFWVEGALGRWSGLNLTVMRLPMIVDVAFLVWAVFWFTSKYSGIFFSTGAAFSFLGYESRIRLLNVNHRWDSAALATASLMAMFAAQRSGRRGLWLLSGFLVAAAAWATPSLALVALPLLVWSTRHGARGIFAFSAGSAFAAFPVALYLESQHALTPMIQSLLWTGANYTAPNRVVYGSLQLAATAGGLDVHGVAFLMVALLLLPAILPAVALVGWIATWLAGRNREDRAEILPLLFAALALVLSTLPRWSSNELLYTMALSWMLCALLLYRLTTPSQRFWWGGIVLVASCSALGVKGLAPLNSWPEETRFGRLRSSASEANLLRGLEQWVQPGDTLFSFPYLPSLYYFLDARNPTRYSFLQPGMMSGDDEQRVLAELRSAPPRWVVYEELAPERVLAIWPHSDPARIPMDLLRSYLLSHYRPVSTVADRLTVMERIETRPAQ